MDYLVGGVPLPCLQFILFNRVLLAGKTCMRHFEKRVVTPRLSVILVSSNEISILMGNKRRRSHDK